MRNSFNINASGGDIGSDEDLCLGSGEVADNLIASALGHISLQLGRIEAAGDQFPGQPFRAFFRIAENDGQVGIVFLQHGTEAIRLFLFACHVDALFNVFESDRFPFAHSQA